jgi:hypothetical protein
VFDFCPKEAPVMTMLIFFLVIGVPALFLAWRYDHSRRAKSFDGDHSAWSAHDSMGGDRRL